MIVSIADIQVNDADGRFVVDLFDYYERSDGRIKSQIYAREDMHDFQAFYEAVKDGLGNDTVGSGAPDPNLLRTSWDEWWPKIKYVLDQASDDGRNAGT